MTYPQPAGSVELKFEFPVSTSPTGVELVFGATVIPAEPQDFIPSAGVTHTAFGDHSIRDPRILAAGFDAAEFGTTSAELATPNVYPEGFESLEFGEPYIAEKPEPTQVTFNSADPGIGGVNGFDSGTATVDHFLQYVDVETGPETEWGTAFIGDRYRNVLADGTPMDSYGDIEVTFPKKLLPLAFDATLYGDAHVTFHNVAFPPGVVTSTLGQPFVAFRVRNVLPFSQQYIDWGSTKVDLWQRYLTTYHPPESNADGELYGQYTTVLNRNKTIGMVGLLSQKFSTSPAYLELTGRAIQPPSIDDGAFGADTFISYRIRSTRVQGYEVGRFPNNTTVYNKAATIRPNSYDHIGYGVPAVDKLLKRVYHFGFRTDSYGTPWASFSPRTLRPVGTEMFGKTNEHYVSHTPYYVQTTGFHNLRLGGPFVYIRPPITVYATWGQLWVQDQKQMGIPAVRRYPPLIEVPGRPYTEFSYPAARVDFRVRNLQPPSVIGQEVWGTTVIRDRTFTIEFEGIETGKCGFPDVANDLVIVIPTTQYIVCTDLSTEITEFGTYEIQQRWLDVLPIENVTQWGTALVWSNVIRFLPQHHTSVAMGETGFGLALIPGSQTTTFAGLPASGYGHASMSPRIIYCKDPQAIPAGYYDNWKPSTSVYQWDGENADLLPKYGLPVILAKRTIYVDMTSDPALAHKALFGDHTLYHGTQEVFPPSFNPFRSGTAMLVPHDQELGPRGYLYTQFGTFYIPPEVGEPFLYPDGLDATESGVTFVTHRDREVFMTGEEHSVLYASQDNPGYNNMYYPVVGEWIKVYPDPIDTEFGTPDVMNFIRYVYPDVLETEFGDIKMSRTIQMVYFKGSEYTEYGVFDNTRDMIIRPYSVQFLCPTSPYTQVLHV